MNSSYANPTANGTSAKPNKRVKADVMKLLGANYEIEFADKSKIDDFYINFCGPEGNP